MTARHEPIFSGSEIVESLSELGFTDVVWLPDSTLGTWEADLEAAADLRLIRVCREGEAWAIAAGLHLGGRRPIVMIQSTGLFESGDALRNTLFDLGLPLSAIVGHRSYLIEDSPDTARRFAEPILRAWGIDYRLIASAEDKPLLASHLADCLATSRPGVVLIAEGTG